jgi:hypothetical protein
VVERIPKLDRFPRFPLLDDPTPVQRLGRLETVIHDRKTPITAAEILNERVLFFEEYGIDTPMILPCSKFPLFIMELPHADRLCGADAAWASTSQARLTRLRNRRQKTPKANGTG